LLSISLEIEPKVETSLSFLAMGISDSTLKKVSATRPSTSQVFPVCGGKQPIIADELRRPRGKLNPEPIDLKAAMFSNVELTPFSPPECFGSS